MKRTKNKIKFKCGHPYTRRNTIKRKVCRTCVLIIKRRYAAKKRAVK